MSNDDPKWPALNAPQLVMTGGPLGNAQVSLSSITMTDAKTGEVIYEKVPVEQSLAFQRARALDAWLKKSNFAGHGLITGSTPDGLFVRVARLLDINTTVCWIDIAPELAEIVPVVEYALTRLTVDDPSLVRVLNPTNYQRRIEWSVRDGWGVALQEMVGFQSVALAPATDIRTLQKEDVFVVASRLPYMPDLVLSLPDLRKGGLTWAERQISNAGIPFVSLSRIPLIQMGVLDVEQARLEIERADRIFET